MQPKNWDERFERTHRKPRVGRVVFGVIILLSKVSHFTAVNPDQPGGMMTRLDLWPPMNFEAIGYDLISMLFWPLAVWLIVTGVKRRRVVLPPEPE